MISKPRQNSFTEYSSSDSLNLKEVNEHFSDFSIMDITYNEGKLFFVGCVSYFICNDGVKFGISHFIEDVTTDLVSNNSNQIILNGF